MISWRPMSAGVSSVSDPVFPIVVRSGAMPMNPSAASWSATLRVQMLSPVFSWMAMTTGAFWARSGYTTHAITLSVEPTLMATHSP